METKVFVYGTLKTGEPNHYWLEDHGGQSRFLGAGVTMDTWPLVVYTKYNIPMMLDSPGIGRNIRGEVYAVDEDMLKHLDVLEAYPHLYSRKVIKISVENLILDCWMYVIPDFREELLNEVFITEYSNKELPWNSEYLKDKDGDFLFNLVKKPRRPT